MEIYMLVCRDLKKVYMNKTAVEDISLTIDQGRIIALLGPNGSGKTTFMKMVAGLVKPTQGSITYNDRPIGAWSKGEIAYMPTEPYFYGYMTIEDAGRYYNDFFADFDMQKYTGMIERMDLNMKDKISKLSSGMAAKLKIALTMSRNAKLYLLDEPLNGIDILARERIISAILEASGSDATIVISTHLVDEIESVVDSAIFIKDGKNILHADAEVIREQKGKSIVELYKEIY